jgi:16S rRNA processing protein RimM
MSGDEQSTTGASQADSLMEMGHIGGPYGVKGWLRVVPYTAELAALLEYAPWYLCSKGEWKPVEVLQGKPHGKGLVVQLAQCNNREQAAALSGTKIGVYRSQFPDTKANEYYWSDLIGLQVINRDGTVLGIVDHLIETGANDVLVVKGEQEYLVPFISGQVIKEVDIGQQIIRIDWDTDY